MDLFASNPHARHPEHLGTKANEFAESYRSTAERVFAEVHANSERASARSRANADKNAHPCAFQKGDLVLYRRLQPAPGESKHLWRPYDGPFRVLEVVSPHAVRIDINAPRRESLMHHDRLLLYRGVEECNEPVESEATQFVQGTARADCESSTASEDSLSHQVQCAESRQQYQSASSENDRPSNRDPPVSLLPTTATESSSGQPCPAHRPRRAQRLPRRLLAQYK